MNSQTGRRLLRVKVLSPHRATAILFPRRTTLPYAPRPVSCNSVTQISCRHASTSSAVDTKKEKARVVESQAVDTALDVTLPTPSPLDPDVALSSTLNPPATTRPPPLNVPSRDPDSSLFTYLFSVGKTYLAFYKAGLKAINTNRKLLKEVSDSLNPPSQLKESDTKVGPTRAAVLLRERTRHDLSRLPVFGLVLLVFGEFTPLVVLAFPKLTPYTCRIPKQIERLRSKAQDRRETAMQNVRHVTDAAALEKLAPGHIVRCLGLGSSIWDKAGIDPPFASNKATAAVSRIFKDDAMIRDAGGVDGLEPDEVVLACEDRAMDVRAAEVEDLRARLAKWIETSTKEEGAEGEAIVRKLLIGLDFEKR